MKVRLFIILSFFICLVSFSQDLKRIEINGKIVVDSPDLEGIVVFNTSSNKGTLTDEKGRFKISVAQNDILELRALLFEDFTIIIDKNIMTSKKVTVFLIEKINKLNEVVILPYDLTGNLVLDMESVRTFNPDLDAIYFGVANINDYEFADDPQSEVENIAIDKSWRGMEYGLNVANLVGVLLKPLFKSEAEKEQMKRENVAKIPTSSLRDYYSSHFIEDNFDIPKEQINDFIGYVESHGLDYSLLEKGKEMQFLEFLTQKSKQFLNDSSVKN